MFFACVCVFLGNAKQNFLFVSNWLIFVLNFFLDFCFRPFFGFVFGRTLYCLSGLILRRLKFSMCVCVLRER